MSFRIERKRGSERAAHAVVTGEHGENERKHTRPRSEFDRGTRKVEESKISKLRAVRDMLGEFWAHIAFSWLA